MSSGNKRNKDINEMKYVKENELDNKIRNIDLLIENNKNLDKLNKKMNKIIHSNKDKNKYFSIKKDKIENSKNIANRIDEYNVKDLDSYDNMKSIITYILWFVMLIYLYIVHIREGDYSKKMFLKIGIIIVMIYFISNISRMISIKYFRFMENKSKYYKDLEYKIIEARDI